MRDVLLINLFKLNVLVYPNEQHEYKYQESIQASTTPDPGYIKSALFAYATPTPLKKCLIYTG